MHQRPVAQAAMGARLKQAPPMAWLANTAACWGNSVNQCARAGDGEEANLSHWPWQARLEPTTTAQSPKGAVNWASAKASLTRIGTNSERELGVALIRPRGRGEKSGKGCCKRRPVSRWHIFCHVWAREPKQDRKPMPVTTTSTKVLTQFSSSFQGPGQGYLIGIFEIAPHRQAKGNAGDFSEGLEQFSHVEGGGFPFHAGT